MQICSIGNICTKSLLAVVVREKRGFNEISMLSFLFSFLTTFFISPFYVTLSYRYQDEFRTPGLIRRIKLWKNVVANAWAPILLLAFWAFGIPSLYACTTYLHSQCLLLREGEVWLKLLENPKRRSYFPEYVSYKLQQHY